MFVTMCFIERKLPKGGAGAIWTLELLNTWNEKHFYLSLVALFANCNWNHYLSSYVFKYLLPQHVRPSGQDALFPVYTVSPALSTGKGKQQVLRQCLLSEWMGRTMCCQKQPRKQSGHWNGQSGQRTCWPFLLVVSISGSVFSGHLPTPPHSPSWPITHDLFVYWDCLVDIMLHCFSSNANNIIFIGLPSLACLDRRTCSVLPCFWLFCNGCLLMMQ